MNRLIRFYNKNRHMVWMVILTVVAIIFLIQILNKFAREKNNNESIIKEKTINSMNNNYSIITGEKIKEETSEIIDEFIGYCNTKKIEKAYELLSDECKEVLYPTLDDFTQNYYNRIFKEKKAYLYQAWTTNNNSYIFRVDFVPDMLATGKKSKTSITDYYTVVKNNNEYRLNINSFICVKDINKTEVNNKVSINVKRKIVYMDYEIFEIEIKNDTKKNIRLDDLKHTKTIYVENNNKQKYFWYNYEFSESDLTVIKGSSQDFYIKFNKSYNSRYETEKIVFSNIRINNNERIYIDILI